MGLFSRLLNELIDIIEWVDTTNDTLIWKFPRQDNAIKMGAKLTVRESQVAVFINEGKIADIFQPGMYELTTQNMPILTTLQGWKYGFESPFKVDVYFVSTRLFTNQKWGTKNPVMLRDAEFGPVRLRAFGSFAFKVKDAAVFLKEVSATNPVYTVDEINEQLRNTIVSRGMDAVAASKIGILDLAANYDEVGNLIKVSIQPDFDLYGLSLTTVLVENISLPPEVEEALDKRTSMGILGNLGAFAQYQAANAIEKSAENSIGGNLGAAGMGLGVGAAMMGQVGDLFKPNNVNSFADTPPPLSTSVQYFVAINGKQEGPFSTSQVSQLASEGKISAASMAWKKGMAEWSAAGSFTELAALFTDNTPPPLPQ
ncbi:SPFH domain-containing protein [Mucilaginibacter limnophilus]|uniref:SPFH domain-containing protein n=1 Tax=Mucilaginibacter limnophilus TaxID=1932778 RepID=A0A3S2VKQ3_9SPHI|nr:SPFH domain-containing protein [Mucilaginibacter limnophilus]RVT98256.1 SPFH domain-containing protein [Mucilaginibacter limnophilus]